MRGSTRRKATGPVKQCPNPACSNSDGKIIRPLSAEAISTAPDDITQKMQMAALFEPKRCSECGVVFQVKPAPHPRPGVLGYYDSPTKQGWYRAGLFSRIDLYLFTLMCDSS
jgi:hypothetical protein